SVRAASARSSPSPAIASAIARPMPRPAPVTTATRSLSSATLFAPRQQRPRLLLEARAELERGLVERRRPVRPVRLVRLEPIDGAEDGVREAGVRPVAGVRRQL